MKLQILAFGAHPDDVELSCSGALMIEKMNGHAIGVIDLTEGDLGTRGTIQTRYEEAKAAALIMQLDIRENLKMADGFFLNDEIHQKQIVQMLRKYQPEIVICNATEDRHPDHGKGAQLLNDACFLSGLRKIETIDDAGNLQKAWRPKQVLHYIQDRYLTPQFVVDISPVFEKKMEAIKAYKTQFDTQADNEPQTYISGVGFLDSIVHRAKMLGKMIGVDYAEGFTTKKMIGIKKLDALILNET